MNRPNHGDLIQKIQELKASEHRLKKRASASEMMLLEFLTHEEMRTDPSDELITNARQHITQHQGEW